MMGRRLPRVVLAARSQAERRKRRAGIRLRDFSITQKTKDRYESAVGRILPYLETHSSMDNLDLVLCDYIELQWSRGESLHFIADGLSGLHFFMPELRGMLRQSWRLFKDWRRIEAPARAPPMTVLLARAIVARAVELNHLPFACLISLGFHALLRTGEMLKITYKDLEFSKECGILSLHQSKSGLRSGTSEAVAIRDALTLELLHTWKVVYHPSLGDKLWPYSPQSFRETFRSYLRFFRVMHLDLKPYSLRRGGATHLLQKGVPMHTILLRGRWHSLAVARLYLQDGLAMLPGLRIDSKDLVKIQQYTFQTPKTAFSPL